MSEEQQKYILPSDDQAARIVDNISGWVDRHGQYWGRDEKTARNQGCTHVPCEQCSTPIPKNEYRRICRSCAEAIRKEKYEKLPKQEWDGVTPLYSEAFEEFFFNEDAIRDYCEENEVTPELLRLILCESEYAHCIDPEEHYNIGDDEGRLPPAIIEAFEALNKAIEECKEPIYWTPAGIAVIVKL